MQALAPDQFVPWFRAAAPYIHAFRGRTFVVAFGGEVVADGKFVGLTHDLNLLASLRRAAGAGARRTPQIENQDAVARHPPALCARQQVTDETAMQCRRQANGQLRVR